MNDGLYTRYGYGSLPQDGEVLSPPKRFSLRHLLNMICLGGIMFWMTLCGFFSQFIAKPKKIGEKEN